MNKESVGPAAADEEINLRELLGLLVDRRGWIVAITLLFALLGTGYALLSTPLYQAQAMAQIESKMPVVPGLADLASLGGGSGVATTGVALLTSRSVVGAAVDQLHLDIEVRPRRFPLLGAPMARAFQLREPEALAAPRAGLVRYGWGGEQVQVDRLEVPVATWDRPMTLVAGSAGGYTLLDADGTQVLAGVVGREAAGNGYVVRVASLRAHAGARFDLVKRRRLDAINAVQRALKVAEQGKDSGILRMVYTDAEPVRAAQVLQHLAEAYVQQNIARSAAEAASQLEFVRGQLPTVRRQVEEAQAAMARYQSRAHSVDITLQTKGLLEQEVAVEAGIQQLRLKQVEMERGFTAEHPAYRALLKQIAGLQARKEGFRREVGTLPDTQQELLRLSRDLQVSNQLYTALLNQDQQLDVARAGAVGNVRIVDAAEVDEARPVKPKKLLIVVVSTLLGLVVSVAGVLLWRMLNIGLEEPAQIEALGLPVYAAVPLSDASEGSASPRRRWGRKVAPHNATDAALLAIRAPADLAMEALRSLRTSLHFSLHQARNNIVAISGPCPGVGKTFVAANLAAVAAQAGLRVLVLDADLRKGTLHKVLGVELAIGMADVLAGKLAAADAVRRLPALDNLHYMTRGGIPVAAAELLMHPRFAAMLEGLRGDYDLLIIDTPPILAVTDAALAARQAGSTLLVTRFGMNSAREIQLSLSRFQRNGIQVDGAVFNAIERRATGYSSYGYYDYGRADA